jgi:hypothetical protein
MIGCLITDSDIKEKKNSKIELVAQLQNTKDVFLRKYIESQDLVRFVEINPVNMQISITIPPLMYPLIQQWFQESTKMFSKRVNPKLLTYEGVILAIILFGSRTMDGITLNTNVHKEQIRQLTYSISSILQVDILPLNNGMKILDVPAFVTTHIHQLRINESTELASFLFASEMKKFQKSQMKTIESRKSIWQTGILI